MRHRHLVYSTDSGRHCGNCGSPSIECTCQTDTHAPEIGIIKLQRQVKGRKGKSITLVSGLPLDNAGLKRFAKELKKKCGTGGSIEGRDILIQGDMREALRDILQIKGYQVELSGG